MIFHNHKFKESETNKEVIFCECGEFKNLHQHMWEDKAPLFNVDNQKIGVLLHCKTCGEKKSFISE